MTIIERLEALEARMTELKNLVELTLNDARLSLENSQTFADRISDCEQKVADMKVDNDNTREEVNKFREERNTILIKKELVPSKYYTLMALAEETKIAYNTLRRWRAAGKIVSDYSGLIDMNNLDNIKAIEKLKKLSVAPEVRERIRTAKLATEKKKKEERQKNQ